MTTHTRRFLSRSCRGLWNGTALGRSSSSAALTRLRVTGWAASTCPFAATRRVWTFLRLGTSRFCCWAAVATPSAMWRGAGRTRPPGSSAWSSLTTCPSQRTLSSTARTFGSTSSRPTRTTTTRPRGSTRRQAPSWTSFAPSPPPRQSRCETCLGAPRPACLARTEEAAEKKTSLTMSGRSSVLPLVGAATPRGSTSTGTTWWVLWVALPTLPPSRAHGLGWHRPTLRASAPLRGALRRRWSPVHSPLLRHPRHGGRHRAGRWGSGWDWGAVVHQLARPWRPVCPRHGPSLGSGLAPPPLPRLDRSPRRLAHRLWLMRAPRVACAEAAVLWVAAAKVLVVAGMARCAEREFCPPSPCFPVAVRHRRLGWPARCHLHWDWPTRVLTTVVVPLLPPPNCCPGGVRQAAVGPPAATAATRM